MSERHLTIDPSLNSDAWRTSLIATIEPHDELVIHLAEGLRFSQIRQLMTSLNTVAWGRQCTLRYDTEPAPGRKPPLVIRYSAPPSISAPKASRDKPQNDVVR